MMSRDERKIDQVARPRRPVEPAIGVCQQLFGDTGWQVQRRNASARIDRSGKIDGRFAATMGSGFASCGKSQDLVSDPIPPHCSILIFARFTISA
jgi:hypothetical protein